MGLKAVIGDKEFKLRTYQFPTRGNQAEDYHLIVDGEKLDATRVRTTGGGGKAYTYIKTAAQNGTNQAYWLEGALEAGTKVKLVEVADAPKPVPPQKQAAPAATPAAAPVAPAAPAKQRPAAKAKK